MRRVAATALWPTLVIGTAIGLGGCGFHHADGSDSSVFAAAVGDCYETPTTVKAQVSELKQVGCNQPHGQEAYALVAYAAPATGDATDTSDNFPGDQVLDDFAQGACAQRFGDYVGRDYLDSTYYFTYLTPSPRSWQDKDRTVICLVTDAGKPMVGTVKGADR